MISGNRRRIAVALAAMTLCVPSRLRAADDPGQEPSRLETKHVGRGDRVTVETKAAAKSGVKIVPFVEDEEQAQEAGRPESDKGPSFRPRFKTPAARQVQHIEVTEDENSAKLGAAPPAAEASPVSAGRVAIDEAFAKSKVAKVDSDYTEVIDLCRKGIEARLKRNYEDYSRKLMGWAYNRRGEIRAAAHQEKEALADFEAAVELNNNSWRAIHNRAVSYSYLGRAKEARADFDRTIKLNKNYANAYFNR
ncbi:MAG TPA: hypothetical protein VGZ26_10240, partial [Pirellulales bacterium]|nr:hypothetical protein [Pirellulales bacterium]